MLPLGRSEVDNHRRSTSVNASFPSAKAIFDTPRRRQTAPSEIFVNRSPGGTAKLSEVHRFVDPAAGRRLMSAGRPSGGPLGRGLDHGMWGWGRALRGFLDGDWRAGELGFRVMGRGGCLFGTSLGRGFHGGDLFGTGDGGHVGCSCLGGRSPWRTGFGGCLVGLSGKSSLVVSLGNIRSRRREWVGSATRY